MDGHSIVHGFVPINNNLVGGIRGCDDKWGLRLKRAQKRQKLRLLTEAVRVSGLHSKFIGYSEIESSCDIGGHNKVALEH